MDAYDMLEIIDATATNLSERDAAMVLDLLFCRPPVSQLVQAWIEDIYDTHIINRGVQQ